MKELDALSKNETWELCSPPKGKKVFKVSKGKKVLWIFKVKGTRWNSTIQGKIGSKGIRANTRSGLQRNILSGGPI